MSNIVNFKTKTLVSFDATKSYEIQKTSLWRHHSKRITPMKMLHNFVSFKLVLHKDMIATGSTEINNESGTDLTGINTENTE